MLRENIEPRTMQNILIGEMQVLVSDLTCITQELKQYRYPKSKKKRIRKKWEKQSRYFKMQEVHRAYKIDRTIVVSSKLFEQLKSTLEGK